MEQVWFMVVHMYYESGDLIKSVTVYHTGAKHTRWHQYIRETERIDQKHGVAPGH